ncbi:MAG TPA: SUF system NifU family Fe-S cluster assembly protein [Stellaceae bacterium]|jgi:nitrogen fixation NifU-like protein|nr:SUF system NifU family Fe-S cluster assembly protein [Stellaceae bacterium]
MMDLRELYQDIILDHGRHPRNQRALEHPTHLAKGHNPLCGDRVTVYLAIDGDRIADVSFDGRGCAISTAAASLMTEVLKGKTLDEAHALFAQFHASVTGGAEPTELPEALQEDAERLEPLSGVKAYPTRIKCATLPWHAFEAALKNGLAGSDGATVKTE